jgi:ferredoxin
MLSKIVYRSSLKQCIQKSNQMIGNRFNSSHKVNIIFIEAKNNDRIVAQGEIGKKVLDVALDYNVDIEGACGGELACSTCHVIISKEVYHALPPKTEEEEDMLDLAWGRTDTSRLCCQIKLTKELEGVEFIVPEESA